MTFSEESRAMRLAKRLRLRKLRWSLRRLHCPVEKDALVLEVGAGGNPYPRANVLLDAMEETIERTEIELVRDRPLVMGLAEVMPFRDRAFDFVIASHVLEHSDDPVAFIRELCRVAKAGYIETPEAWFEKMCPFVFHRLAVTSNNGRLVIEKKPSWNPDPISKLHEWKLAADRDYARFLRNFPDAAHMRFYWSETIDYQLVNPDCDASWTYPSSITDSVMHFRQGGVRQKFRMIYLAARRRILSQTRRNKRLEISQLLRCPTCYCGELSLRSDSVDCPNCLTIYPVKLGVPYLFPHGDSDLAGTRSGH